MRVLHIVSGRLFGGVETMLVTMARFRASCPEIAPEFALCFDGRLKDELLATGVKAHDLGAVRARNPLTVLRARRRLREILGRERIDTVICHLPWAQAIFGPVAREAGVPLIFWMHGAANGEHWVERWARMTVPVGVICNSQFTAATLRVLYPSVAHQVIYCPVSPGPAMTPEGRSALRSELKTAADDVVVIDVGRMEPWKGHHVLIEALSKLRDRAGWTCWIVGGAQRKEEAEYLQELQAKAEKLGISNRLRFIGGRDDVPRLMSGADIYCQPNVGAEPFGIALVEALYVGLPVVTSALGGAVEIVDQSCGMLSPPGNVDQVAASLESLIGDAGLRRRLGSAGFMRAKQLTDPATQLAKLKKALDEFGMHRALQTKAHGVSRSA